MPAPSDPGPRYRERLYVPPAWWVLGALFCLSLGFAVGWYLGLAAGLAGGLVPMALLAALFVAYGGAVVGLEGDRLTAGRAQIELRWVRAVTALTPEEARARRGPQADTRAYLLLRPYVTAAVEVTLADPADPAPYWLISSRRPRRLAGLVASALPTSGPDRSRPVGSGG